MKTLYVDNSFLQKDRKQTYLSADATNGNTTITVQSIVGFAVNQILLIGEIGQEKSEIIKTHAATAPSGSTITLASALSFDHPADTKVYIILWDQVEFSDAATATGVKAVITTINLQADQIETLYDESTVSSGFYFSRFKESIGGTFSSYSDPIPVTGWDDNMVGGIKERALDSINEQIDPQIVTHKFINEAFWEGRREYHNSPGKRPFRRKFNFKVGTVSPGMYRIALSADVQSPYTAENIYAVRIGANPQVIKYYDKKEFDNDYTNIAHTTLATAYTVGDQDLYLSDADDFLSSGSVNIENDTVSYSAVGLSGATLRISTAGTSNHALAKDVWQGVSYSTAFPLNFTVWADEGGSAYCYFSSPIGNTYNNQNIYMDYYTTVVPFTTDGATLDEPEYDMYVPYLAWRIKQRKSRGILEPENDPDYKMWQLKKANSLSREYLGTDVRVYPDIPT